MATAAADEVALEVQLGVKNFGMPGITKESLSRLERPDRKDLDETINASYHKLNEYKKKKGLNVLYTKPTAADLQAEVKNVYVGRTRSQQRFNVEKAHLKSTQLEKDDKMRNALNIYWLEVLVESDTFHMAMVFVISLHCLLIVCISVDGLIAKSAILPTQLSFLVVYSAEILLKWRYGFAKFWGVPWNVLTAVVWVAEVVTLSLQSNLVMVASTMRIFRFLVPFKSRKRAHYLAGVRSIVGTVYESVADVGRISMIVVVMSFFWASWGVIAFADVVPLDFGSLWTSYFTLFVALTQIGWIDDFKELQSLGYFTEVYLFYITYFIIVVFVVFKLVVAVVVSNLEEFHRRLSYEKKKRRRKLRTAKAAVTGQLEREISSMPDKPASTWKSQIALEVPDFALISKDKLENYFAVLSIMEVNLREYSTILEDLRAIQGEIQGLNTQILADESPAEDSDEEEYVPPSGDALSRILRRKSIREVRLKPTSPAIAELRPTNGVMSPSEKTRPRKIGDLSSSFNALNVKDSVGSDTQTKKGAVPAKKLGLSDFQLEKTLGTGSFGRVHLVKEKETGKYFAMKALAKATIMKLKQVEHTLNEKRILERLQHPFLVSMVASFQDTTNVFFVLEYVQGGELFSYLRKCNNILISAQGHVKITDFGFAKVVPDQTWTLCGTPDYLAPEIIQSKGYTKAVDWWALGILIYEMVAGYPPFYHEDPMKLYENILQCKPKFSNAFDPNCKDLVKRLLVLDLSKRFGNLKGGVADIKNHKWFTGVDWIKLTNCEIEAPYVPAVRNPSDTSQFDQYDEEFEPYGKTYVAPCNR
ncbi:hypothetical protein HDU91_004900 [Kappamyces sp. JEL0680]|nr:hypothetical protein HDU91_004900 [Kappamyces sp. JEL0680]